MRGGGFRGDRGGIRMRGGGFRESEPTITERGGMRMRGSIRGHFEQQNSSYQGGYENQEPMQDNSES